MVCSCFKPPPTSEEGQRRVDHPKGNKKSAKAGVHSNDVSTSKADQSQGVPQAPEPANGKQGPVDRESPVSVFSGPGDDVSSDQRKSYDPDHQHSKQDSYHHPPPKHPLTRTQQSLHQPLEAHGPGHPSSKLKLDKMPDEILGMPTRMDVSGPRGFSDSHVQPETVAYLNKLRKTGDQAPPQLPGGMRANSPHPSQKLHLQRDREVGLAAKPQGSVVDQFEKQRLKQQLLQQQTAAQRASGGPGSTYASALPGKSRVLAWLDESELGYATIHEADNKPCPIHDQLSPVPGGKFLSALKHGQYEDLAGQAVTRDVLIKRGMQRAQLLPDGSAPLTSSADGSKSPSRHREADRQRERAKAGLPPPSKPSQQLMSPHASTTAAAAAAGGAPPSTSTGLADGVASAPTQVKALELSEDGTAAADAAAGGAANESSSGREPSPIMQGLLNKTTVMLRQRSLDGQGRARLANVAAGMNQEDATPGEMTPGQATPRAGSTEDVAGSCEEEGEERGGGQDEGEEDDGKEDRDPKPPSAPVTPDHSSMPRGRVPEHLSGPLGSWAAMSPALGMAGSNTDAGSRGRAATPDALSDMGGDSTEESPNDSSK